MEGKLNDTTSIEELKEELANYKVKSICDEMLIKIYEMSTENKITKDIVIKVLNIVSTTLKAEGSFIYNNNNTIMVENNNISSENRENELHEFLNIYMTNHFFKRQDLVRNGLVINKKIYDNDKNIEFYKKYNINKLTILPINEEDGPSYMFLINSPLNDKYMKIVYSKLIRMFKSVYKRLLFEKELQKKINLDNLTGLLNANVYQEAIRDLDNKDEDNLILIVADLFRLKYVNDNLGHSFGDKYIKLAGHILLSIFEEDAVYRIGGDEFAIIIKNKDEEYATTKIEMAKEFLEEQPLYGPNDELIDTVISMGYAIHDGGKVQYTTLFNKADSMLAQEKERLYLEKHADRRK